MSLTQFFIKTFAPKAIIDILQNIDWYELGRTQSKPLDLVLDGEFGEKKSEIIQLEVLPALDKFIMGFKVGLVEDQKKEK